MPILPVTKTLVLTYFAGQANAMQKSLIKDWLKEEANQELYFEWLAEWQAHSPNYIPDSDDRLLAFLQFMETAEPHHHSINITPPSASRLGMVFRPFANVWLKAASVLLLIGLTAWLARDYITFKEYKTAFGETKTLQLADGTTVILNANSALTVPRFGFGKETRSVSLTGEAFFHVKHTVDNQKFLVKTNKLEVVVYGTEFTVKTGNDESKVLLKTGKVHLRYADGAKKREVVLKPGDLMTIDKREKPLLKPHVDTEKLTAWIDHRFVFDRMPLKEVSQQIREHFGVNVLIEDPAINSRMVTGTFRADNADELIGILADMFDFQVSHKEDTIVISTK